MTKLDASVLCTDLDRDYMSRRNVAFHFLTGCSLEQAAVFGAIWEATEGMPEWIEATREEWAAASGLEWFEVAKALRQLESNGFIYIQRRKLFLNSDKFSRILAEAREQLEFCGSLIERSKAAAERAAAHLRSCLNRALVKSMRGEDN